MREWSACEYPSFLIKQGDVVEPREKVGLDTVRSAVERLNQKQMPAWIHVTLRICAEWCLPKRHDLTMPFTSNLLLSSTQNRQWMSCPPASSCMYPVFVLLIRQAGYSCGGFSVMKTMWPTFRNQSGSKVNVTLSVILWTIYR
jgi:hypothetical protein